MTAPVILGDGAATLYLGDCLDVLRELEENSVDAVVTDPPYLNLRGGYVRDKKFGGVGNVRNNNYSVGDNWRASLDWSVGAWRVARLGAIVMCSFKDVAQVFAAFPGAKNMGLGSWYQRNAPPTGKNVPRYDVQFIWFLSKSAGIKFDALDTMLFDIPFPQAGCFCSERVVSPGTARAAHPCQKPLELMKRLLLPGINTVLDPFMGSGTTGVAAIQLGRRFIGVELDPGYFDIAVKRIERALLQPRLFAAPADKPAAQQITF